MYKWNKCTMHAYIHACLKNEGFEGEDYSYPIYGVISDSNGFYAALTNRRRLLLAEIIILTGSPVQMYALELDNLLSVSVKKNIVGQYTFTLVFNIKGKKRKFILLANKKLYGSDFDEQEQNLMEYVDLFEKMNHKLKY